MGRESIRKRDRTYPTLAAGHSYQWWVRGVSRSEQTGEWSSNQSFQIAEETATEGYRLVGNPTVRPNLAGGLKPADHFQLYNNGRGGELEVELRYNNRDNCCERYRFTWEFNKDIRFLRPGDEVDVTIRAERLWGNVQLTMVRIPISL